MLLTEADALDRKRPFFGKRGHLEKTADKLTQAGNAFRAERDFVHAGESYMRGARIYQELEDFTAATRVATDASKMFAKDPTFHTETMAAINFAVDIYKAREKRVEAAELLSELAKILIEENNTTDAVHVLQEASDLFKAAGAQTKSATILEAAADLLAEKGEFVGSAAFYREVAAVRLSNSLTQGSSGMLMFKAILVQLQTNDIVGSREQLEKYLEKNPVFRMNSQCKFLFDLMEKIDQHDIEGFDQIVDTFKLRNVVDSWLSNRLIDLRKYADADGGML
jgi:tetratricopeptide (TPR) repeat protein